MEGAWSYTTAGSSSPGPPPAWQLRAWQRQCHGPPAPRQALHSEGAPGPLVGEGTPGQEVAAEPVVAYLRDARSGEISLFVGAREVTLHDRSIAAKLAAAAGKEA